ncbi:MAG: hypothetical protein ACJ0A8_01655, partial [Dehalococcoidia bacterium]
AVYSAGSICAFLGAVIAGRAFDKFGARVVLTAVTALFGLAIVLMGQGNTSCSPFLRVLGYSKFGSDSPFHGLYKHRKYLVCPPPR